MRATRLDLVHFRSAKQFTIDFEPGLNLLVGINGAGKSTVLDGLAIMLSWAAARLRSAHAGGRRIVEMDIHNEKAFSWLELTCATDPARDDTVFWRLTQTRKGRNPELDPQDPLHGMTALRALNDWAGGTREQIGRSNEQVNLPLFAYYPVNRSVLDIPLRIRKPHTFALLEAYDGALTTGANFRSFFEWYRNREDLENERFRESAPSAGNTSSAPFTEDSQLRAVRKAIRTFLPEISEITIKRNPLRMEITKNGDRYRVDQLSDGEKCLFAMVGDLARRLAIANPNREDALEGEGIVLIDEIDLHLHPAWQRMVAPRLMETFPHCQFVVSTHSPQVFGEVDARCIRRLTVDPVHGLVATTPQQAFGLDSSEILEEHMDAESRNRDISLQLKEIFRLIDLDEFTEARTRMQRLRDSVRGNIPELLRAESLMTMLEPVGGDPP